MADEKEPSKLEQFINKIPDAAETVLSYTPPGLVYRGAKAVGNKISEGIQSLPEPTSEGLYGNLVTPAKNLVAELQTPETPIDPSLNQETQDALNPDTYVRSEVQSAAAPQQAQDNQLKGIENKYLKSIDDQGAAKQAFLDANLRQAEAEAEALQIENAKAEALAKQQEEERNKQLALQDEAMNSYQSTIEELESNPEVDPNRFWSKPGSSQKVLAAIGLLFGAAKQAVAGGENPAIAIINKQIDRDIAAQQEAIDRKKNVAGLKSNLLSQMNQRFNNLEASQKATKLALLEQSQRKMNQIASQFASPKIKAQQMEANAQFDQLKAKTKLEFQKAYAEAGTAKLDGAPIGSAVDAETVNRLKPEARDLVLTLPDGSMAMGLNKETVSNYNKFASETIPAVEGIDRITQLTQDFNRVTDPTKRAQIKTELQALAGQLRLAFTGPGALTDKEYERLASTIGDPTKLATLPAWEIAKLKQVKSKLINDLYSKASQAGIKRQAPSSFKKN